MQKKELELMSCQIFKGGASATDAQRAQAYVYAADNGACIAQCSYGNTSIITDDQTYINGNEENKIKACVIDADTAACVSVRP